MWKPPGRVKRMDSGKSKTYEEEMVDDMISLMSSFSSKIYGKHSAENRKRRKFKKFALAQKAILEGKAIESVEIEGVEVGTNQKSEETCCK